MIIEMTGERTDMPRRGDILDNTYQIIEEIGHGGGGIVYKAIHLRLQKYVAVKKIRDKVAGIINVRGEADILKNLHHTYLPQVYDFLQIGDQIFTVMDFIPGESLDYYLKNHYTFQQRQIIIWAKQLCEALQYLHTRRPPIIHSDVKPANIMITPEGNVCLIDFNISLDMDKREQITGMSTCYASPEQQALADGYMPVSRGGRAPLVDAQSDIYSLGATLYHMMTGNKPSRRAENTVPINQFRLGYSKTLTDIVGKAMHPDKNRRYRTAQEMYNDLDNIYALDERYKKHKRLERISTAAGCICIAGFLALTAGGVFTMRQEKTDAYEAAVQEGNDYAADQDYDKALGSYDEAIGIFDDKLDAYYQKLYALHLKEDYPHVLNLGKMILSSEKLSADVFSDSGREAAVYYMMGDACFEQEDYEGAVGYYKKAVNANQENAQYFRDYAIALIRNNQPETAQQVLNEAVSAGLGDTDILLVKAELALKQGQYQESVDKFGQVLSNTDDEYIRQRSYLLMARAFRGANDLDGEIRTLEEGRMSLDASYLTPVISALGDAYARKAGQDASFSMEYNQKALECYQTLVDSGMASDGVKYNMAAICQNFKNYEEAARILNELEQENPNDYKPYMRLALLECDIQGDKENSARDYTKVKEYYDKASQLYAQVKASGGSDDKMQALENIMEKLYSGNWLTR